MKVVPNKATLQLYIERLEAAHGISELIFFLWIDLVNGSMTKIVSEQHTRILCLLLLQNSAIIWLIPVNSEPRTIFADATLNISFCVRNSDSSMLEC